VLFLWFSDPQAKIATLRAKLSSLMDEIITSLSDISLKVLQAQTTTDAAKFIPPLKTIKQVI
jgi:hypothetical protein